MKQDSLRTPLRLLAALLAYPDADLRAAAGELSAALREADALTPRRQLELQALINQLRLLDPFELESRYVDTFDRGRSTSLHLFEHVHGDSRERGPALIDLQQTYARAGLLLAEGELPDHLTVVLEFASTQPADVARGFLGEMAHILDAIFTALQKRGSPYAAVIAAVLELAGHTAQAVAIPEEPTLDEAWAEPAAFDGCSTHGQAKPDAPQPIHIVRKPDANAPQRRLA